MISVSGLRLIDENGKFLQSLLSLGVDAAAKGDFLGTGVTILLRLVVGAAAVVAKNAFSTADEPDTTCFTGGGRSGG